MVDPPDPAQKSCEEVTRTFKRKKKPAKKPEEKK
jgi:hypothetical protein